MGGQEQSQRAHLVETFKETRDALAEQCAGKKVFRWLLEETGATTKHNRKHFSEILGQMPIAVHSADFGWAHWLRLWWGICHANPHGERYTRH